MNTIGIIVAMSSEFQLVSALLTHKEEKSIGNRNFLLGKAGNKNIILAQSGIGKVCSAVGVLEMIQAFHPDCIINTGVAGGIDISTRVMDIVIGKEMVYHDVYCGDGNEYGQVQGLPPRYTSDSRLLDAATAVKSDLNIYGGLICSGDQFITDRTALNGIKEKFPEGLAVDMESCSMAQVCYMYHTPFLSLRIISDTPGAVDDHTAQYNDFWTSAPEKSFEVLKQLLERI